MTEQISALIDDELPVEDAIHVIAGLQSNKQSADAWSHYHLIGDAMRDSVTFSPGFKRNLMQKLELEPTILAPNVSQSTPVNAMEFKRKFPMRWSVAASFAAVMLVGWMAMHQQMQSDSGAGVFVAAKVDSSTVATTGQPIPSEYLMAHQASAPSASSYYVQTVSHVE